MTNGTHDAPERGSLLALVRACHPPTAVRRLLAQHAASVGRLSPLSIIGRVSPPSDVVNRLGRILPPSVRIPATAADHR